MVVYARWQPGLPFEEQASGYTIKRVPALLELAIPGRRSRGRRRVAAARRRHAAEVRGRAAGQEAAAGDPSETAPDMAAGGGDGLGWVPDQIRGTTVARPLRAFRRIVINPFLLFPLRPRGWAVALDEVAEHADIWHGMWAGSLPALLSSVVGTADGRSMTAATSSCGRAGTRGWASPGDRSGLDRAPVGGRSRSRPDGQRCLCDLLARDLRVRRPTGSCEHALRRGAPPSPGRTSSGTALDLPVETRIVLYQGRLTASGASSRASRRSSKCPKPCSRARVRGHRSMP